MKIICVLQNAWGNYDLPMIFEPNPHNYSAKVINKICGEHTYHFSNSTSIVTTNANQKAPLDLVHLSKLIVEIGIIDYDVILICGTQSEKAFYAKFNEFENLKKPTIIISHPAARISNIYCDKVKDLLNQLKEVKGFRLFQFKQNSENYKRIMKLNSFRQP
jgi:hypothetical protein